MTDPTDFCPGCNSRFCVCPPDLGEPESYQIWTERADRKARTGKRLGRRAFAEAAPSGRITVGGVSAPVSDFSLPY